MAQHLLVADDDEYIRDIYEEVLKDAGFDVDAAINGEEAYDKISKTKYDLVMLDIMMPKMDGMEVLRKVRKDKNKAKVVFLTNLAHDPLKQEGKSLGALAYLVKADMTPDQLVNAIKKFL